MRLVVIAGEQDVAAAQVAVDDVMVVQVRQPRGQLRRRRHHRAQVGRAGGLAAAVYPEVALIAPHEYRVSRCDWTRF